MAMHESIRSLFILTLIPEGFLITTGWMCPYKEHRLTVTGETGSLVFDDTLPWAEKLTFYRDDITPDGANFAIARSAPVHLPVPESEPLKQEMRAFISCCETGAPPPTDIADGLAVQHVLQAIEDNFIECAAATDMPDATRSARPRSARPRSARKT